MKQYLTIALSIVLIVLVISLVMVKRGDDAQHDADTGTIDDFSNQLSLAQTENTINEGIIIVESNNLTEWQSSALTFSNGLTEAETTNVLDQEQITNLTGQIAEGKSENQALQQNYMDLTNQMAIQAANLTKQITATQASLDQANQDYQLLEDRLRRDVAERVLVERKFDNLVALQAQIKNLKENPAEEVSADKFYMDLGVEVNSNGTFHVISLN